MRAPAIPLALAALLAGAEASATWSVAATDTTSGAVGSAGASCVPYEVILIYGVAPGRGVVDAQANFDTNARDEAAKLLAEGVAPDDILTTILDPAAHPKAPKMQFGIVDTLGRRAGYTGPEASAFAAHRVGVIDRFPYAIQGNLLTSARVLDQAEAAFTTQGCDLADKLMLALEAGAANGEGDGRCTPDGLPASSAFIDVTLPDGVLLHVSLPDVSPDDPIRKLRAAFDTWRLDHPCPAPVDAGSTSGGAKAVADEATGCACTTARASSAATTSAAAFAIAAALTCARRSRLHRSSRPTRAGEGARPR